MSKKLFINLPVANLQVSMNFYSSIGFTNNPQFTDHTAACMVISDEIYVMLLTADKFKQFTTKQIADTETVVAVINCLSLDSKQEIDEMVIKAVEAGGKEPLEPKDYGFMQQRSFEDPDGHLWEVLFMDLSKMPH